MNTETKTTQDYVPVDLSGETEPMYVTHEQAIAINGYRDLVSLFTAGMERAKKERIMEGIEHEELRNEATGAGFFEYYVRHLPHGPADFRQEMIVMYDFMQRIPSMAQISLYLRKLQEHPDKEAMKPFVSLFLRTGSIVSVNDGHAETAKNVFFLYNSACEEFSSQYPDFGLKLINLLQERVRKFLKESAMMTHYAFDIVSSLRSGSMYARELRNAELALTDLSNRAYSYALIPSVSDILLTGAWGAPVWCTPLSTGSEAPAEFFPVLNTPFITELSSKASLTSSKDIQRTGEEILQFVENTAKHMWETYCAHVGGTAIDDHKLPDWETFRNDPAKKRQSDGWIAMARALVGEMAATAVFTTHYGQTDTIPFLDSEFEINGALAIPIILRYRNAALIPHDNPTGRVVVDDLPGTNGRTSFMVYDVEKKFKSIVAVTSDDYSHPFRVVLRQPEWSEYPSEFTGACVCDPDQAPLIEDEVVELSDEEVQSGN